MVLKLFESFVNQERSNYLDSMIEKWIRGRTERG